MSLGLSDDHLALHDTARRWVTNHCPPSVPRALLDADAETMPPFWGQLADARLARPAPAGGRRRLGLRARRARGRARGARPCVRAGAVPADCARVGGDRRARRRRRRAVRCSRRWPTDPPSPRSQFAGAGTPVLGAALARPDRRSRPTAAGTSCAPSDCTVTPRVSVDETRRVADVDASNAAPIAFLDDPDGAAVTDLALTLLAAECAGGAAWCVETAAEYAQVREQFGRPIGQFQGVKHRCADMLLALEQARAVAWDAARPDGRRPRNARWRHRSRARSRPAAFFQCAKDCVQVLGGIGFTWEHDAHLYLKRATALRCPDRRRSAPRGAGARSTSRGRARGARSPSTFPPRRSRSATRSAPTSPTSRPTTRASGAGCSPTAATSRRTGPRRGDATRARSSNSSSTRRCTPRTCAAITSRSAPGCCRR